MNHPGSLIGLHHGDMAIYPPVLLVREMSRDLWVFLVKFLIGLLEILPIRLDETILLGVNKAGLKKEFPQGIHIYLT